MLVACATTKPSSSSVTVSKSPKVLEMERKLKERGEALQDTKDRNRVLAKKSQMRQQSEMNVQAVPQNKKIEITGMGAPIKASSDRQLYAEMVASYDRNNEIAFFSRLQAFMERYPKSPLADEALYLAGLMSLSNKNYGPALRYMNQILKNYPTSN